MARFYESWILETCILAFLSSGDAYGYEIAKNSKIKMSESSVYPILRRLEDQKLLTVYSQQSNTRLRKFYHITDEGLKALEEGKITWAKFRDSINEILK